MLSMKRVAAFLVAVFASLPLHGAPAEDLLARMAAVNPNLHTFTATIHVHVAMKTVPFLTADLTGAYYHKEPDKTKVVFTSGVPLVARAFDKLYAHIESPSNWRDVYTVALVSDNGKTAVFKLTPRKHGNVDHIDATVDDNSATVTSMRWNYDNGGFAEMFNRYSHVGTNVVVASQKGHVEEPGYAADLSSTIDNYKINPPLSDSVFQ
jgi:outer membrane lipoprotein-sorting protein